MANRLSRRSVLQAFSAGVGLKILSPTRLFAEPQVRNQKTLVSVFLSGGLDALSFLPPTKDTTYDAYLRVRNALHQADPTVHAALAIPREEILSTSDPDHGLHPRLGFLQTLLANGQAMIIKGVGQVTARKIGHSGSHAEASLLFEKGSERGTGKSGWLGAVADVMVAEGRLDPEDPMALVNLNGSSDALRSQAVLTTSVQPRKYVSPQGQVGFYTGLEDLDFAGLSSAVATSLDSRRLNDIERMLDASEITSQSAVEWQDTWKSVRQVQPVGSALATFPVGDFPATSIGAQFKAAAQIINSGCTPLAIGLKHEGYDHHSNLYYGINKNLFELDNALRSFFRELEVSGRTNQVLVQIVSEFGRRIDCNSSSGVDHGAGGVCVLLGPSGTLRAGIFGSKYSVQELTSQSTFLETIDFRDVYAEIIAHHYDVDPRRVLNDQYDSVLHDRIFL